MSETIDLTFPIEIFKDAAAKRIKKLEREILKLKNKNIGLEEQLRILDDEAGVSAAIRKMSIQNTRVSQELQDLRRIFINWVEDPRPSSEKIQDMIGEVRSLDA